MRHANTPGGPLSRVGIRGRLGDLGHIDGVFDVAVRFAMMISYLLVNCNFYFYFRVSTACSNLDFIVVDTTEGAQACISFLRENNIGRTSFIVLDQVRIIENIK